MLVALLVLLSLILFFLEHILFGSSQLPPVPNAWQVLRKLSDLGKKPHIAFSNMANIYGPLMSLRLGGQLIVVASSSATAKQILKTQDRILSGRCPPSVYYKIPGAIQSSISMSKECNDTWKSLRGLGQNCIFSSKSIESKGDIRMAKMRALTTEIIEMVSAPGLADLFPVLKGIDFWNNKKGLEIYRKIMYIWEDMVKEKRVRRDNNATSTRDYLDVLLENKLPDEQINFALMV
ncbi:hypothetical protein BUALT_Bualt06G0114800 [Buddleja alternifolia]|uniref:Uncharacterized protein n=1 Tax=Buddleja alternifolia TaxID=168488 RepID=A0AAV6XEK0_9LAMI|nr:hypothetical protein BUALT_Bualt06G0114800 [Buddleja alternifolia]